MRSPGGTITSFDTPGSTATYAYGLNAVGGATGVYYQNGTAHGYLRRPFGKTTSFDVPNSQGTFPTAINIQGFIRGYYNVEQNFPHAAFLRVP